MGFFDSLINAKTNANVSKPNELRYSSEAAAFLSILMSCGDVDYNPDEADVDGVDDAITLVVRAAFTKPFLKGINTSEVLRENHRIKTEIGHDPALRLAISQLSPDNRKSVFIYCFDIVFVNTIISPEEKQFIDKLAVYMELDKEFLEMVSEIVRLKFL